MLLAGLTNEATLWIQAGLIAEFLLDGAVLDMWLKVHKDMVRWQMIRLLRRTASGDNIARVALADWHAAVATAVSFMDASINNE